MKSEAQCTVQVSEQLRTEITLCKPITNSGSMREPNLCTSELFSLGESDKKGFFFVNILGTASNLLSLARASWELGCAESAKLFPVCLLACTDGGSPW